MNNEFLNFETFKDNPEAIIQNFTKSRIPYFEETTFGRCLGYLLYGLKWQGKMNLIIHAIPHSVEKFDFIHLKNTMAHLGYKVQEINIDFSTIDERLFPCLFIPNGKSHTPFVLLSKKNNQIEMYDSRAQKITVVSDNHFKQGKACFFNPVSNEEFHYDQIVSHIDPNPFRWFRKVLDRLKPQLIQGFILTFFISLFGILTSLYIKSLYDNVINIQALDSLKYLFPGILLAIVLDYMMRNMRLKIFSWFGSRLDAIMSPLILEKILKLPPYMTESATLSSQLARMRDFDAIRDFCSGTVLMTIIEIPFIFVMLLAVYLMGGNLVFIPLLVILLFILLMLFFIPKITASIDASGRLGSKRYSMTVETLDKIKNLKTIGNSQTWFDQLRLASGVATLSNFHAWFLSSVVENCSYAMYVISGFSAIAYGIHLIIEQTITAGALIGSMLLIWRILAPLQTCMSSISVFIHFRKSIIQIHKLLSLKTEEYDPKHPSPLPTIAPNIQFSNLIFKQPTQPTPIFNGINLNVQPGEIIMIVGRNGTGKTTFLKLVEGMYQPQVGSIKINNMDIRQFDPAKYRHEISYVPEKTDLFYGTIAQNLKITNPTATDEDITTIFKKLNCEDKIKAFPEGIHHQIGDANQGITKSIGFQINLARAILRNAPIMLIDEAPHAYTHSEQRHALETYINEWRGKKTTFIVANNESLIPLADRVIYLIGDGRMVVGSPEEVLKVITKQFGFNFEE